MSTSPFARAASTPSSSYSARASPSPSNSLGSLSTYASGSRSTTTRMSIRPPSTLSRPRRSSHRPASRALPLLLPAGAADATSVADDAADAAGAANGVRGDSEPF